MSTVLEMVNPTLSELLGVLLNTLGLRAPVDPAHGWLTVVLGQLGLSGAQELEHHISVAFPLGFERCAAGDEVLVDLTAEGGQFLLFFVGEGFLAA